MSVYYNENDPAIAAWLRVLMAERVIPDGELDTRSIEDVRPNDLRGFRHCHFFAGIGGWAEALQLSRWPNDREVWTGSCPCQPFSAAGAGDGFADQRHLWPSWFHLIAERRPATVLGEQVDAAVRRDWLDLVYADLESAGYAIAPAVLPAAGVGAPQPRHRLFFVADANGRDASPAGIQRSRQQRQLEEDGGVVQSSSPVGGFWRNADWIHCADSKYRPVEPGTFPVAHGLPARLGRLRGYGNAIVPQVAVRFVNAYLSCY